jgi:hypothetical protein
MHTFASKVGARVLEQYDQEDGSDLAFNLLEMGVISESMSVDEAARIVAPMILLRQYNRLSQHRERMRPRVLIRRTPPNIRHAGGAGALSSACF